MVSMETLTHNGIYKLFLYSSYTLGKCLIELGEVERKGNRRREQIFPQSINFS